MAGNFGEVRSILNAEDGAKVWGELCRLLDDFDPAQLDAMVLPYIDGHVRRWEDAVCVAPQSWVLRALAGEALPFWSIIRKIDLSYQYLDADDVLTLLASPRLAAVTILDLDSNRIGSKGAEVIAGAESLTRIEELRLSFNQLGQPGLKTLIRAESLASLRVLDLEKNALGHARVTPPALSGAPWLRTLTSLNLSHNNLTAASCETLLTELDAPALEHIRLDHNAASRGVEMVSDYHREGMLPSLRSLEVRGCRLRDESLQRLFSSPLIEQLERLDLSYNNVVDDDVIDHLLAGAPRALEQLDLGKTEVTRPALERLLRGLPSIKKLSCPSKGLSDRDRVRYSRMDPLVADAIIELREMAPGVKIIAT